MELIWLKLSGILIVITLILAIITGTSATWRRIQKKDTHVLMYWLYRFTVFLTLMTIFVSIVAFYLSYLA